MRSAEALVYYMGSMSCKGKGKFFQGGSRFSLLDFTLGHQCRNVFDSFLNSENLIRFLFGKYIGKLYSLAF